MDKVIVYYIMFNFRYSNWHFNQMFLDGKVYLMFEIIPYNINKLLIT